MTDYQIKIGAVSNVSLSLTQINELTGANLPIEDGFYIDGVTTPDRPIKNRAFFIEDSSVGNLDSVSADMRSNLIISNRELTGLRCKLIVTRNPRECYSNIAAHLFDYYGAYWNSYYTPADLANYFGDSYLLGNVMVHKSSSIGSGSIIYPGVVIGPNCRIGKKAIIKPNSVIGYPGFGIFKDDCGNNTHLPHVGGVIIGDNVELGALNTVCAGTIHPTVVEDYVKTDDHVHIAHNCIIRKGVQIAAHAEISGSVVVEEGAWLSPNISITNGIVIGARSFVGIGSCVTKSVRDASTVAGNPARPLSRNKDNDPS